MICRPATALLGGGVLMLLSLMVGGAGIASAASLSLAPEFSNSRLGQAGSLTASLSLTGSEYGGWVAPATEITLQLPSGVSVNRSGASICEESTIAMLGLSGCPKTSIAGEAGVVKMIIAFGLERLEELGTVQAVFEPGDGLDFFLVGNVPVSLEVLIPGTLVGDNLTLKPPLIETVPGGLDTSITALTLRLGTGVILPDQCPRGTFAWAAEVKLATGTTSQATAETTCPETTAKGPTTTMLQTSNASPALGETVTYTATVQPEKPDTAEPGGPVEFLDGGTPIGTCAAQPLTQGSSSPTATCQVKYPVAGSHSIEASYGGDTNFMGSSSAPQTVSVHVSPAQIAAELALQLIPRRRAARIAALLKNGGLKAMLHVLEGGTAVIDWFDIPAAAKLAGKTRAKPILVAAGRMTFPGAETAAIRIRLTSAGRHLLKSAKRLRVAVRATFTPTGETAVGVTKAFTLKR
jgi:Bacterial Ig-like domain (group 3)